MLTLTTKELVVLVFFASLILGILASIIRKGFAVIISIWAIFVIASLGFFWLPDKVGQWSKGETTITDTMNDILSGNESDSMKNAMNEGKQYISDNYQSWEDAASSLLQKVKDVFSEYPDTNEIVSEKLPSIDSANAK